MPACCSDLSLRKEANGRRACGQVNRAVIRRAPRAPCSPPHADGGRSGATGRVVRAMLGDNTE